jgi:hypothetical protein
MEVLHPRCAGLDVRGRACAQMALAKSFVFHVVRARRICEHGAGSLKVDRSERRLFLQGTAGVLGVRDVNEHGFDAGGAARGKSQNPPCTITGMKTP